MSRDIFNFKHAIRIRWPEVDRQDVVFFGHHFNYFDMTMTEYLRRIGFRYPQALLESGTDFYIVKTSAEYSGNATFDDIIEVHARAARIGRTSLTFDFETYLEDSDALLVKGTIVYVNADIKTRTPAPLPDDLIQRMHNLDG